MFFLILVVFLLMGGVLALITLQNLDTLTHLNLYFWQTPQIPVGLLLLGAIVLGAAVLYLVALLSALRERHELKRLRVRVAELEEEQKRQPQPAPHTNPALDRLSQQPTAPVLPIVPRMPGATGPLQGPPRK